MRSTWYRTVEAIETGIRPLLTCLKLSSKTLFGLPRVSWSINMVLKSRSCQNWRVDHNFVTGDINITNKRHDSNLIISTQQGLAKPLGPCFWLQSNGGLQVDNDLSNRDTEMFGSCGFFGFSAVNPSTKKMWTPKASPQKKHEKQSKFVKKVIERYQIPSNSSFFGSLCTLPVPSSGWVPCLIGLIFRLYLRLLLLAPSRHDLKQNHFVLLKHSQFWHPWHPRYLPTFTTISLYHHSPSHPQFMPIWSRDSTSQMYSPSISHRQNHLQFFSVRSSSYRQLLGLVRI